MAKTGLHVKNGDMVMVISGKDAGKKGKVIGVEASKARVFVEGVNIIKRHTKPTQAAPQGGIVEKEAAVAASNVMLYCEKCNKATRISKKENGNGKYVRQCKHCGQLLD